MDEPAGSEEEISRFRFPGWPGLVSSWWRGNGLVVLKLKSGANEFLPLFFAAGLAPTDAGTRLGMGVRAGGVFF